jgi:hypothetical protein
LTNTKDTDTDPSTPSARRSSRPAPAERTDPGVGDPVSEPIAAPDRPLGIVVPAPGASTMTPSPLPTAAQQAVLANKDSVEILLEGMTDQRAERTRTTPQSDGQASASYHSAHTPHASEHVPNDDVPKVLLDRPLTPTTVSPRLSPPPVRARAVEMTAPPAARLGARVAIAAVAGVLVAGVVFLVLEMAVKRASITAPAAASASSTTMSRVTATITPGPSAGQVAGAGSGASAGPGEWVAAPAVSPAESAPPLASSTRGHGAPVQGAKRRPKGTPTASGDLGEFRTNF